VKGEEQLPTEAPRSPQFKDLTPVPEEELKSTTAPTVDKIFAAPKSMIDAPQQAKSDVPKDADAAPEDATELIDQPIDSDPEVSNKVLTRPTYMVLPRDTLVSIARELFNDERLAWLIVDLNSGSVEQTTMDGKTIVDLKARQVLYLPVWTDIEQFFRRKVNRNPDDLVTIVNESQIDVELRDSVLGKAMGTETKPPNAHTYPDVRVSSDTRFHPEFSMQAMAFLRGFQRRVQFKHSFTD
jgi:hypothetical protein